MERKQQGLSLMELMITLVIVAIIATFSYSKYEKMVAKAKQTEAKTLLQTIYTGQSLYHTINQEYADSLSDLDIEIPANTRYAYTLTVNEDKTTYLVTATANLDGDEAIDEWTIDQTSQLINIVNDALE
ncbi:MAG: prepilin-type N-terminal cleavage/methylation domain-containing protein [Proteobacteria bacterium]|nr:prepilin-type N-terminal cleavage/methylation domain-containing protein [Pseudomonadota bacterium]